MKKISLIVSFFFILFLNFSSVIADSSNMMSDPYISYDTSSSSVGLTLEVFDTASPPDESLTMHDGLYFFRFELIDNNNSNIDLSYLQAVISNPDCRFITYEWDESEYEYVMFSKYLDDPTILWDLYISDHDTYVFEFVIDVVNYYFCFYFAEELQVADLVISSLYLDVYPGLIGLDPAFNYTELQLQMPWYDLMSINDIQALLTAEDDIDGDLTDDIEVYDDTFSEWEVGDPFDVDGVYPYVIYSVSDSQGNIAYCQVDIVIYNDKAPDLYIDDELFPYPEDGYYDGDEVCDMTFVIELFWPLSQLSDQNIIDFMSSITFSHPYYGEDLPLECVGYEYTSFEGYEDYWSEYFNAYHIVIVDLFYENSLLYSLDDDDDERVTMEIIISYYDDSLPSFEGSPSKVVVGNSTLLTIEDLEAMLVVSDSYDDSEDLDITVIKDEYTGFESKLGRYVVTFRATDPGDNYIDHSIVVWVFDLTPPMWIVDDQFITVSINELISEEDLNDVFVALGIVDLSFYIEVLSDQGYFILLYDGSVDPGTYELSLRLNFEDSSHQDYTLFLTVEDAQLDLPVPVTNSIDFVRLGILFSVLPIIIIVLIVLKFRRKRIYR